MSKHKKQYLGRTLTKAAKSSRRSTRANDSEFRHEILHTTDIEENLNSITQLNSLESFLHTVELQQKTFEAEKQNTVIIDSSAQYKKDTWSLEEIERLEKTWNVLQIPKRPKWDKTTTKEQLNELERESFLEWRRKLVKLEEEQPKLELTPYEKNIQVWKQLWRVTERSHLLVQIVDARNPMLFRCLDLETYAKEHGAVNLLLINKADFLDIRQRRNWAEFLVRNNVNFAFFSAELELKAKPEESVDEVRERSVSEDPVESSGSDEEISDSRSVHSSSLEKTVLQDSRDLDLNVLESKPDLDDLIRILTKDELILLFYKLVPNLGLDKPLNVGLVGYPNVGKSSTLNVLFGGKKVAVSSTPGKTKHLQTLVIENGKIILCDCPGLVFPTFISSKADMICNGLMRVDEMKDFLGPMTLLCSRIPKSVLENTYGLQLPPLPDDPTRTDATTLLQAFANMRGFKQTQNRPDEAHAARLLLKDYVSGILCYPHPPPGMDPSSYYIAPPIQEKKVFKNQDYYKSDDILDTFKSMGMGNESLDIRHEKFRGKKGRKKRFYVPIEQVRAHQAGVSNNFDGRAQFNKMPIAVRLGGGNRNGTNKNANK